MSNAYTRVETLLRPAARVYATTGQLTTTGIESNGRRGCRWDIDITVASLTSLVFTVEYWDPAKGDWVSSALATAALSSTGHTVISWGPDFATSSNVSLAAVLPLKTRLKSSGTWTSFTGSISQTFYS